MSSRRLNSSYSQIPLNVTRRLTEEGKKIIRETCLYFVRGAGGQRLGKVSQSAQELVRQSGMAESLIRSVSEDDVLKSLKSRKNREEVCGVFVLEHLSGTLYEELRLRSKETPSCRVIRPIAILHSQRLNNEVTIPVKPHPLLSMAMDTVPGITLAGDLSPEERHSLARKIMLMCGRPLSVIRPNVTAVVVSRNMTDLRCIEARKMGIVILTPEWVEYCYTESDKNNYVFGRDCYKEFMLPAFAGMTFSPAQISPENRENLRVGAVKYGYKYLPNMDRDKTTHLICERPEGDKWEMAQKWRILCVSMRWVVESLQKDCALPEDNFLVGQHDDSFLPDDDVVDPPDRNQDVTDLRYQRKRLSKERRSVLTGPSATQDIRKQRRSRSPSENHNISGSSLRASNPSISDEVPNAESQIFNVSRTTASHTSITESFSHLLDKSIDNQADIFDGSGFYLLSCDGEKTAFLKRLILNQCGFMSNKITDDINFVIIGSDVLDDEAKELIEKLKQTDHPAVIVNYKWLIECAESGAQVDYDRFVYDPNSSGVNQSPAVEEQPNLGFRVTMRDHSVRRLSRSFKSMQTNDSVSEQIPDDDLLMQYSRELGSTQTLSHSGNRSAGDESSSGAKENRAVRDPREAMKSLVQNWEKEKSADSIIEDWDDACSVVSSTFSNTTAVSRQRNSLVTTEFDSICIPKRAPVVRPVFRPQAIHNKINEFMSRNRVAVPEMLAPAAGPSNRQSDRSSTRKSRSNASSSRK